MNSIIMGGLSALFLGSADFVASQSSERISASRALAGMLFVSTIILAVYVFVPGLGGYGAELFASDHLPGVYLSLFHGVILAFALLLFYHAMAIGSISIVAPILAAHPVFIIIFAAFNGTFPSLVQLGAMALTLLGVGIVGATGRANSANLAESSGEGLFSGRKPKTAPKSKVVMISLGASLLYAGALITLQGAVQILPDILVLWLARASGLIVIVALLLARRQSPLPPSPKWGWVFVIHGILDSGGLLFLMLGTDGGPGDVITIVVGSAFPLVTVTLAWAILKERLTRLQIIGALKIFIGVGILAATWQVS